MSCTITILLAVATHGASIPDLPMPTLGGKQFWADELFFHQWRIQRNVLTGHCRLLDKESLRHASGSFPECRAQLDRIRRERNLPPMKGKAVIAVHGLFRSRSSMEKLCQHLHDRGGYQVFNVGYPTTQRDIGAHARTLGRIIDNLDGIEQINFVAHSMGNIVVRHYLADRAALAKTSQASRSKRANPRFGRLVMLGPPNHGSMTASVFGETAAFKIVTGDSGLQLGAKWNEFETRLTTPDFEFGIIAGGKSDGKGYNPLLSGDNDGVVTVASTRLAGARDFVVLPVLHSLMIVDPKVQQYTLEFLDNGYFISPDQRRPVKQ